MIIPLSMNKIHGRGQAIGLAILGGLGILLFFATTFTPRFGGCGGFSFKGNMRTIQIAVESYFADAHKYPTELFQLEPFLPGGDLRIGGHTGTYPDNPLFRDSRQGIVKLSRASSKWIDETRNKEASKSQLKPGQIAYVAVNNGESYAVIGADSDGITIAGVGGKTLVLSCQ